MAIDPVVLLAEELRSAEAALGEAAKLYDRQRRREHGEMVNMILASIKSINREFFETIPTSALGASELVHMVARQLPFTYTHYVAHFHEVADRFGAGQRLHNDLVWLRAMRAALAGGLCGEHGIKAAPLLGLAIIGAARPVVVFRSARPVNDNGWERGLLARRPR